MKHYYTCPIKAAFMAKYHNFSIVDKCDGSGRIYVMDDSLSLLEPQVGDGVEFDRWHWDRQRFEECKDYPYQPHLGMVVRFGNKDEHLSISSPGHGWDNTLSGGWSLAFKIIQRNGEAFFMPEVES